MVEKMGWRAAFAIVSPVALLGAAMIAWKLNINPGADSTGQNSTRPSTLELIKKVDFLGSFLLSLTIVCFLLATSIGSGWKDPWGWGLGCAAILSGFLFCIVEISWVADPISPPSLLEFAQLQIPMAFLHLPTSRSLPHPCQFLYSSKFYWVSVLPAQVPSLSRV